MEFLIRLILTNMFSIFLLVPLFKLISPEQDEWTILALFCTSFLVALSLSMLWDIRDRLVDLQDDINLLKPK